MLKKAAKALVRHDNGTGHSLGCFNTLRMKSPQLRRFWKMGN